MSDTAIERLILLDSGLRAERGHHANFTRLLTAEARRRNWSTTVFSHAVISEHLRREFHVNAHFTGSPYDLTYTDPACADIENYLTQNELFQRELEQIELPDDPRTLVLIPTITHNQLLGFAKWLQSASAPQHTRFAVVLLFSPGWQVLKTPEAIARSLYHHALRPVRDVSSERLALLAETQPVADEFTDLAERQVHVAPWPTAEPHVVPHIYAASEEAHVRIGYLGYAKRERGIHLLPEAVRMVLEREPRARFFIQVDTFLPETVQGEVNLLVNMQPRVTLHQGSMPRTEFLSKLAELDVVLLPYDPDAYRRRGSALFSEAAMLGKPMIVTGGTWMAEQMTQSSLGGMCIERFDSGSIADATIAALRDIDSLTQRAHAAATDWKAGRTAAAFLDTVVATMQVPEPAGSSI